MYVHDVALTAEGDVIFAAGHKKIAVLSASS
jgi:hypothetical protein